MDLIAIYNSKKKHSVRYDLVASNNTSKIIGSIYWPKDFAPIPAEFKILLAPLSSAACTVK
jgi:hypothetical protein